MPTSKKKKQYQKPAIVFAKKVEVISATCNSGFGGLGGCRLVTTPCVRTKNSS